MDSCWSCDHIRFEVGTAEVVFRCAYNLDDLTYVGRGPSGMTVAQARDGILKDYKTDWCPIDGRKSTNYALERKLREEYWNVGR